MPAEIIIDLADLEYNITSLQKLAGKAKLIPVVKANAYGHGAQIISHFLQKFNFDFIATANFYEALQLQKNGYKFPILIMGAILPNEIPLAVDQGFDVTISSFLGLKALESVGQKNAMVHIKIDTAMNRAGVSASEYFDFLEQLVEIVKNNPQIIVKSIYSQLASSSDKLNKLNLQQYLQLNQLHKITSAKLAYPIKMHIFNSGGLINYNEYHSDYARIGISMYGISPNQNINVDIKPILSWIAPIAYIRAVTCDQTISYNQSGLLMKKSNIATIICGYGDGLSRQFSNGKLNVLIAGKSYPIIGDICMDMTMVNLGDDTANIGDYAVLIGTSYNIHQSVYELAKINQTIPYEILCSLTTRNNYIYQ